MPTIYSSYQIPYQV